MNKYLKALAAVMILNLVFVGINYVHESEIAEVKAAYEAKLEYTREQATWLLKTCK